MNFCHPVWGTPLIAPPDRSSLLSVSLFRHLMIIWFIDNDAYMHVELIVRFELTACSLRVNCSTYWAISAYGRGEETRTRWPTVLETVALPTELHPYFCSSFRAAKCSVSLSDGQNIIPTVSVSLNRLADAFTRVCWGLRGYAWTVSPLVHLIRLELIRLSALGSEPSVSAISTTSTWLRPHTPWWRAFLQDLKRLCWGACRLSDCQWMTAVCRFLHSIMHHWRLGTSEASGIITWICDSRHYLC